MKTWLFFFFQWKPDVSTGEEEAPKVTFKRSFDSCAEETQILRPWKQPGSYSLAGLFYVPRWYFARQGWLVLSSALFTCPGLARLFVPLMRNRWPHRSCSSDALPPGAFTFALGILPLPAKLALHILCSCGTICSQAQVVYHSVAPCVIGFVSLKYLIAANVYT